MNAKNSTTAQKLVNLYRQAHVIVGGWATVNPVLVKEATDNVIAEMQNIPTGKMLIRHIENLRSGQTPMDSIERELMPYGGLMVEELPSVQLTKSQWNELENALQRFTPDQSGLDMIQSLDVVHQFGPEWPVAIRTIVATKPNLIPKWDAVVQTYSAYRLWNTANEIIANPLSERVRAQVQADMPEYETYLPMFGDAGDELLRKLRTFISSMN